MKKYFSAFCFSCFSLFISTTMLSGNVGEIPQPEELGTVQWIRDYDQAILQSESTQKPILILFQEVPGCSTCRGYGNNVLSHPLIVEAIETEFVPLAIHNNKGGKDKKILESFNEPSWNNPVVRIIDNKRKALTPRINGQYDQRSLVNGMVNALKNADKSIPTYLQLLQEHLSADRGQIEKATFGMYCFWTGEAKLGSIEGVVSSEPGFMSGSEVVSVEYNPDLISYEELLNTASKQQAFDRIFVHTKNQKKVAEDLVDANQVKAAKSFRPDGQPKYYLLNSSYRFLPMLPNQASRVNTALGTRSFPDKYLSPRQLTVYQYIQKNPKNDWKLAYSSKNYVGKWEDLMKDIK